MWSRYCVWPKIREKGKIAIQGKVNQRTLLWGSSTTNGSKCEATIVKLSLSLHSLQILPPPFFKYPLLVKVRSQTVIFSNLPIYGPNPKNYCSALNTPLVKENRMYGGRVFAVNATVHRFTYLNIDKRDLVEFYLSYYLKF